MTSRAEQREPVEEPTEEQIEHVGFQNSATRADLRLIDQAFQDRSASDRWRLRSGAG
jgi:hypothetical protein